MNFKIKKRDIILSLICGELTSLFLFFIIKNPYIEEFRKLSQFGNITKILPIALPLVFLLGIFIGEMVSQFIKMFSQFVRFFEVGILNTFLDIGILNLLVWLSGVTSGSWLILLNTVSFLLATTNSYFLNRFWTFQKTGGGKSKEYLQFLTISAIGWLINTSIVVSGTTFLNPFFSLSAGAWVNLVKISASFVSMLWNFTGYKFIVFKK